VTASPPYWSEADAAELDVLIYALVRSVLRHRDACAACAVAGSGTYCNKVDQAIGEVLGWQRFRALLSKAEWLRGREAA